MCSSIIRKVSQLKINSALTGAIKLPFRKLNSILCAQVGRPAHHLHGVHVGVNEGGDAVA
jgi:hypothetical protein